VNLVTVAAFAVIASKLKNSENEFLRMALGGCIAHTSVETGFHILDTINIRSKANPHHGSSNMLSLTQKIWAKEGIFGFFKGFSAAFYGSVFTGFTYFYLYKSFKHTFSGLVGHHVDISVTAAVASFCAELITLTVQYPFDTIKCRLQSVNNTFKYKNLLHAFKTEIFNNGPRSLYVGMTPFVGTYCTYVALQFSIYEKIIETAKRKLGIDGYR
jgi:hypothetical protein